MRCVLLKFINCRKQMYNLVVEVLLLLSVCIYRDFVDVGAVDPEMTDNERTHQYR